LWLFANKQKLVALGDRRGIRKSAQARSSVARGREIAGGSNGKLCPAICQHVATKRPSEWERYSNVEWESGTNRW